MKRITVYLVATFPFRHSGGKVFFMQNGLEGRFVLKNNRKMALGYTTGSCSAAAAKAATIMLFTRQEISIVSLMTPKGIELHLEVKAPRITPEYTECAIKKEAGDDPDVTDGILVFASVFLGKETGQSHGVMVHINGGTGIGKITKPGLEQPVGAPAINRIPREMITEVVKEICEENEYQGDIYVEISIPQGIELAKKTFNPRLGIEGGISVLGTTGIVEPMSETALLSSIRLEMQMHRRNGLKYLVIAPGNYGTEYLSGNFYFAMEKAVKCSNFVGDTIDIAVELGFKGILFVSHIGKFIKVAGGIMNTHSRNGDARMEILAANALRAGADGEVARKVLEGVTTEDGLHILMEHQLMEGTMKCIMEKIKFYLDHRAGHSVELAAILFSNQYGELGRTENVKRLIEKIS